MQIERTSAWRYPVRIRRVVTPGTAHEIASIEPVTPVRGVHIEGRSTNGHEAWEESLAEKSKK